MDVDAKYFWLTYPGLILNLVYKDSCPPVASTSAVVDRKCTRFVYLVCIVQQLFRDSNLWSLITVHASSLSFEVVLLLCAVPHQVDQNFMQELAALAIALGVVVISL